MKTNSPLEHITASSRAGWYRLRQTAALRFATLRHQLRDPRRRRFTARGVLLAIVVTAAIVANTEKPGGPRYQDSGPAAARLLPDDSAPDAFLLPLEVSRVISDNLSAIYEVDGTTLFTKGTGSGTSGEKGEIVQVIGVSFATEEVEVSSVDRLNGLEEQYFTFMTFDAWRCKLPGKTWSPWMPGLSADADETFTGSFAALGSLRLPGCFVTSRINGAWRFGGGNPALLAASAALAGGFGPMTFTPPAGWEKPAPGESAAALASK